MSCIQPVLDAREETLISLICHGNWEWRLISAPFLANAPLGWLDLHKVPSANRLAFFAGQNHHFTRRLCL